MIGKFDRNVMKLEKQINNINENIYKFRNKNHKTMLTIIEKIKLFNNIESKPQNKNINLEKIKINETPKKTLIKRYQSLSSNNMSFTTRNKKKNKNGNKQNNNFMLLREDEDEDIYNTYNNKLKFHSNDKDRKIYILSDFNSVPDRFNENYNNDFYEHDNNDFKRKNCISFNNDNCSKFNGSAKNRINDNNNESRKRTYSYNYNTNNNIKNEFTDDYDYNFINEDLNNFKKNKNKKLNNKYKKEEQQKRISDINYLTDDQNNKLKQIKYIKRESCNLNISNYYRNIKNKNSKKKNSKIKITNNQKLKKHLYNKKDRLNISNNNKNYSSRNYSSNKVNNNINNRMMNKENEKNEKEYTNIVCSTFNPYYFKNSQRNPNFDIKRKKNLLNSFRDKSLVRNNTYSNNNNINNLNPYKYNLKKNPDLDNNKIINFNHNVSNNKKNNNFNKDFIDIITNNNNGGNGNKDINNNMYNNIIYHKKEIYRNNNNIIKEGKIDILFLKLNSKNIDECLHKIDILLDYEDFIYKINSLYNKIINFNKNILINKRSLNAIFSWIESIIEENKKQKESLKRYQIFCGKLTEEFSVDGFDKFKNFIVQTLNKNKKSQSFTSEKKIISESNIYKENKNIISKRNGNISINTYFYNNEDYSPLKNRTLSYSNISMNHLKNGEDCNINNTFYLSNKNNKTLINQAKNYNII